MEYIDLKIVKIPTPMGTDKLLHLLACYFINLIACVVYKSIIPLDSAIILSALTALLIGFLKECYDKYIAKGSFDGVDICFDVIGIALFTAPSLIFTDL